MKPSQNPASAHVPKLNTYAGILHLPTTNVNMPTL